MKKVNIKRLLALFLCFSLTSSLLFTACKDDDNKEEETTKENAKKTETPDNPEFAAYMEEVFKSEMSLDTVTTHFKLENPEVYGVDFENATWGEPMTMEYIEKSFAEQKDIIDKLESFDRDTLSKSQQLTYDTLYTYLSVSYNSKDTFALSELFSPMGGVHYSLPIIFSEYDFFDDEDIDDYLTLLETVDDYVNSLLDFERERAAIGYFLTDTNVDTVVSQCEDFISPDENCLVSIFSDKLDEYGVSETEKTSYMERLNNAIDNDLIPSYEKIIDTLLELKGSRSTELGLSGFEGGKEYYEALVRDYTGSDKSVEELITVIEDSLTENTTKVYTIMSLNPDIYEEFEAFEYPDSDPESTILTHIEQAKDYFPEIGDIPFEVHSVPESLESTMNPAFYLVPPIDNPNKNAIYINYSDEYADMDLHTTLAHEGVPGHMYQCYYFSTTNPDPVRHLMSFGGYSEGWATYVEYYSYLFAGMDKSLALFTEANSCYNFGLYCRIDLGIHYEDWTLDDVTEFLGIYGIYDEELCHDIFYTLIDDPAVYLQYFVGYLEIQELYDKAEENVDNFNEIEFHKFLLEVGPTYFELIDARLDEWIKEQNE